MVSTSAIFLCFVVNDVRGNNQIYIYDIAWLLKLQFHPLTPCLIQLVYHNNTYITLLRIDFIDSTMIELYTSSDNRIYINS